MADSRLTEKQVADLATILRGDASLDAKVQYVTNIKSGIKQHNVPEASVPHLFEGLRAASTAQHAVLINAGFTALNHLLTRMSRQDPKLLSKEAPRTLPVVIEKLGDQKDKFRSLAMQALNTFYGVAPAEVERFIRNSAMGGKNPRTKEGALQWLLETHRDHGLQFRGYVPSLMELLEDADGMVRDAAKSTVIELFTNAPNAAKSDLKRQLKNFKVRPAIEQAIVKALAPTGGRPETPAEQAAPAAPSRPAFAASVSSMSERPMTPGGDSHADAVEPMYVNTNRELDDIFKDMAWHFEGRETEQNWLKREQGIMTLRKLNAGNVPAEFQDTFIAGLRAMLDGIIKSIVSLRTSLSKEGCSLVQDVANTFGPAMDPLVELLMQSLVKLSAGTKKISSQQANTTVDIIIGKVTYTPRLMQHIWGACQDKNVQPRLYSTGWLKTLLKKEAHHKSHIEHTGGVDLMEKCIKKGLGDPNPGVREKMRSTYWAFWGIWPARADAIMADLDQTAQKLLNKDPNNPNSPKKGEPVSRPGLGLSKSTMSSKPSLRDAMMAGKKASVSKNLPARPGSAMAHLSPVRTTTTASSSQPTAKSSTSRGRPESTISVNAKGMSVAPMRPNRRRPELAARPATAGPYSVRDQPSSMEVESPESIRPRAITPKPKDTTPRRTAQRPRPGHASHASESNVAASPTLRPTPRAAASSPRLTPPKLGKSQTGPLSSSPSRQNEEMTLVVPDVGGLSASQQQRTEQVDEVPVESPVEASDEPPVEAPQDVPQDVAQDTPPETSEEPTEVSPAPAQAPAEPMANLQLEPKTSSDTLKVYEDPFTEEQPKLKPAFTGTVLEDRPVNEDAASLPNLSRQPQSSEIVESPEKSKHNARLLQSGINKIRAKSLEVHGFRKLQALIRDGKTLFSDDTFEALLLGLFQYLEDPLDSVAPEKAQDVKAQILATIKLLLKRERANFQPHVSKGLESLLQTRSAYEGRAHIVSGLELLADELVAIGDGAEIVTVLSKHLQDCSDADAQGCRTLSMGLHVLKELLQKRDDFKLSETELGRLAALASQRLDSADSGVRMDAVQLCVALHARVGETAFWQALSDVKDDPKSLITYYIVKRQREQGVSGA